jgi:NAD(P)-dependent dehydrogenase (short-subunit alcohol dehydrogenase family)
VSLFSLTGKVALVTGGTSGIGAAIATALRDAGARVLVCARAPGGPPGCAWLGADLSTRAGVTALAAEVTAREPALHVLVHNAGTTLDGPWDDYPEADWDATFALNVKAPHYLTTALLAPLRAAATPDDPARVVHVGSMDGLDPQTGNPAYGASKAALHHLARSHARELAAAHITVNAIAPGVFPSRLTASALRDHRPMLERVIPLGRIGRPEEVGGTVVYLASRAGAFTTGTVLAVDGGVTAFR